MIHELPAPLSRKIHKVLETKTDSPDLHVALKNLSSFYGANTPVARSNLRGEIEKQGLEINNNFIASFKVVEKVPSLIFLLPFLLYLSYLHKLCSSSTPFLVLFSLHILLTPYPAIR
jgi:hypothetical protein